MRFRILGCSLKKILYMLCKFYEKWRLSLQYGWKFHFHSQRNPFWNFPLLFLSLITFRRSFILLLNKLNLYWVALIFQVHIWRLVHASYCCKTEVSLLLGWGMSQSFSKGWALMSLHSCHFLTGTVPWCVKGIYIYEGWMELGNALCPRPITKLSQACKFSCRQPNLSGCSVCLFE